MHRHALFHTLLQRRYLAPNGEISRTVVYLGSQLVLMFLFLSLPGGTSHSGLWMVLAIPLGFIVWGLWYLLWLLRLERRRLCTLGSVQWLAPVQPMPSAIHDIRPTEVTLRPRLYTAPSLISGVLLILLIVWFPFTLSRDLWTVFFLLSLMLVICITLALVSTLSRQRATLEITPTGLTVKEAGAMRKVTLAWSEARFFACYREPGLVGRYSMTYELSGRTTRVSWRWILRPQSPLALWKPNLPAEEYHWLMQGLCALIVRQTGLPLYDLSQKERFDFPKEEREYTPPPHAQNGETSMVAIKVTSALDVQLYIAKKKGYLSDREIHRGVLSQPDAVVHDLAYLCRVCQANLGRTIPHAYYAEDWYDFDEVYGAGKWRMCQYCREDEYYMGRST